jgi:ADP-heptose:LPS heptosyltransferase
MCRLLVSPSQRACIVCLDSVLGHIAAAFPALPVVSLWSSFRPADRVEPYSNHRPIYNPIQCSPCRAHEQTGDPRHYRGCPLTGCNDYCAGLRNIEPSRILTAVQDAIEVVR